MLGWPKDITQGLNEGNALAAQVTTAGQTPELFHSAGRALNTGCFVLSFLL